MLPTDLVIRPSGIRDTRAPFHSFFLDHRGHNRAYALLTIGLEHLKDETGQDLGRNQLKKRVVRSRGAAQAWASWLRSFSEVDRQEGLPSGAELADELPDVTRVLRHTLLASYLATFDHYVVCWTLNLLLTLSERKGGWSNAERRVANDLSPVHPDGVAKTDPRLPTAGNLLRRLGYGQALLHVPHVVINPDTGTEVEVPVEPRLNAWTSLDLWRGYRNDLIHRHGIASTAFVSSPRAAIWPMLIPGQSLEPLRAGHPLPTPEWLLPSCFCTHYKVARWLQDHLIRESGETRGHIFAPGKKHPAKVPLPWPLPQPKPLLIPGDHPPSLEWASRDHKRKGVGPGGEESATG